MQGKIIRISDFKYRKGQELFRQAIAVLGLEGLNDKDTIAELRHMGLLPDDFIVIAGKLHFKEETGVDPLK